MAFCYNCGKEIVGGSRFCEYCGAKLISKSSTLPTTQIPEEHFIPFIGKNSYKYLPKFKKFNTTGTDKISITWHWPAFFLPFWWMLYRKIHLLALFAFVLTFTPYINLLAMIVFGMTGNSKKPGSGLHISHN